MFQNHRKQKSALGIDRWSKYIWLAYVLDKSEVILPIWYLLNDQMIYFNISDIINRHNVNRIIIWRPARQKDIQEKIQKFIKNLNFIIENMEIEIELVEEDYTSVQSWEIVSNFKKNSAEDTISAMLILGRRQKKIKN